MFVLALSFVEEMIAMFIGKRIQSIDKNLPLILNKYIDKY